jgi:hypothetical protein
MFFHNEKQDGKYLLQEINLSSGNIEKTWFSPDIYNKGVHENSFRNESFFYSRNQGAPKYVQCLMDTVLSIQDNEIIAFLAVKDKYWITVEDTKRIAGLKADKADPNKFIIPDLFTQNKSYDIFNFVEVSDLIFFKFVREMKIFSTFYNVSNQELNITTNVQNDLVYKKYLFIDNIACADQKGIYGYIDSEMLPYLLEQREKANINTDLKEKNRLIEIEEDSNPVIFYYEYKN